MDGPLTYTRPYAGWYGTSMHRSLYMIWHRIWMIVIELFDGNLTDQNCNQPIFLPAKMFADKPSRRFSPACQPVTLRRNLMNMYIFYFDMHSYWFVQWHDIFEVKKSIKLFSEKPSKMLFKRKFLTKEVDSFSFFTK